jgi:predicted O-methyltransferase YrrM
VVSKRLEHPPPIERLLEAPRLARTLIRRARWAISPPWEGFGEPFNGQLERRRVVDQLCRTYSPDACIETGTFLGHTTRHLASYGRPVYTFEVNPAFFHLARLTLYTLPNATLICADSVQGLSYVAEHAEIARAFVYLDAHWEERLPLVDEVNLIFDRLNDVVVLIDDFFIPHQPGYAYDVYKGVALSMELIGPPHGAVAAYPTVPASKETGARRGAVWLGKGEAAKHAMNGLEAEGMLAWAT